jgi:MOSC domain-containing protein YiiM
VTADAQTEAEPDQPSEHAEFHRDTEALLAGVDDVRRSPRDAGTLHALVVRPGIYERRSLDTATLDLALGVVGDTWIERGSRRTADGGPNPDAQVTVMNSRAVDLVAGNRDRWALAGDQLYVDLDLSVDNLPTGTLLSIGDAQLEVTAAPHTGCAQFKDRFGVEALRLTSTPDGRELRLRGINTRVVRAGDIAVGDTVRVTRPTSDE